MAAILDDVMRGRIKVLFVSPERLTSPSFRRLFRPQWNSETKSYQRKFPEVSLLCVDEAHCMSQWAHNFRPCFLRFKGLLCQMNPKSILAITATAGPRVIKDIVEALDIETATNDNEIVDGMIATDGKHGVKVIEKSRDNIDVTCQFVENAEDRLAMVRRKKGTDISIRVVIVVVIPTLLTRSNCWTIARKDSEAKDEEEEEHWQVLRLSRKQ